jgi:hypothetical protein
MTTLVMIAFVFIIFALVNLIQAITKGRRIEETKEINPNWNE